ncbi:methylmalonyl Co-A mutase-associated GTPase MeaB [Bacillus taeanensis]|uniref:Methylmalonyl Co-A mutase-associated GTPase MeaB n=1 Tax=Bacillus taeanensis TaxID=273032 RepID=A0A366Y1L9_9BACI|nr:methylmalonyl Co-A mutase-associated GTPase MeaB [Bacillus taeanensis]RBW70879.1 methylmalonyl Co-A mutase-associated GTPase MeaB [Bacillus taeanensis]
MTEQKKSGPKRRVLSVEDYVKGILKGNRAVLAQAITLVESSAEKHRILAQTLINQLLPYTGKSIRIGITGVPGAGKSTFIEALGTRLCNKDHRTAVLAVDPSSSLTKGSILGDKTRMEKLSKHPNAYIRPSPSRGMLGGVANRTRETMLLCEAAGFNIILVETVGTGQSEKAVRSLVDFFLLIMLTGAGDELQGMKKGIIEMADAVVINKADGENKQHALTMKAELNRLLHFLVPSTVGWETKAYTCSARNCEGIETIWKNIETFCEQTKETQVFHRRRNEQLVDWVHFMIEEKLKKQFYENERIKEVMPSVQQALKNGECHASSAVERLFKIYENTH